jgi:hypothetical protein
MVRQGHKHPGMITNVWGVFLGAIQRS